MDSNINNYAVNTLRHPQEEIQAGNRIGNIHNSPTKYGSLFPKLPFLFTHTHKCCYYVETHRQTHRQTHQLLGLKSSLLQSADIKPPKQFTHK